MTVAAVRRHASAPVQTGSGDRAVVKFTLIRNDYAGKDEEGSSREKKTSIQFTAFRGKGEAIAMNCMKGDQLIVTARIENNNWTDKEEVEHYGYNFVVEEFDFGAPGPDRRAILEQREK